MKDKILIVELVENCKLVREGSKENGHDCWGNIEHTSYKYVYINYAQRNCWDGWYIIHDGENVIDVRPDSLRPEVEYQESAIDFNYGWTPSTEKDYSNPKDGFEYRMILKSTAPIEDKKAPVSDEAFEMHKLHMLINVLEEFDIQVKWRGEHWTVVMPESHEPFASTIKMNERTKAIQQAIDCF